ncbi:MAG: hypothetical protein JXP34_28735, partial [Planctomycetes bacterium]|nr:hypothetical protein [Planctomycetota bacterium]
VELTATPAANWHFAGWSGAVGGSANPVLLEITGDLAVMATFIEEVPQPVGAIVSDDFSDAASSAELWTVVDPVGDGSARVSGNALELDVPGGVDHDLWRSGNRSVRVMQAVADADFEMEVKFVAPMTERYQLQGLLAEEDESDYVRFNVQSDGVAGVLRLFAASIAEGLPTARVSTTILEGAAYYLRVARAGDRWTFRYSYDGATWATAGVFDHALAVNAVGVFGGNAIGSASPAFTAVADYFFNTAFPIVPEDGGGQVLHTLAVTVVGEGTVTKSPDRAEYAAGEVVELTATPAASWRFAGWSGAIGGSANPVLLEITGDLAVMATFVEDPPAPAGEIVSDDFGGTALNEELWTFVDPVGDGSVRVTGGALELDVPGGVDHDLWRSGNRSVRVMQAVADADFEMEVKFVAPMTERYQLQGLLAEEDESNYVRFNVQSDGVPGVLRLFAASIADGLPTARVCTNIPVGEACYLRVARAGDRWTFRHSTDGVAWATAGVFDHGLAVNAVGVFGGNAIGSASPAFTAVADYFRNTDE